MTTFRRFMSISEISIFFLENVVLFLVLIWIMIMGDII